MRIRGSQPAIGGYFGLDQILQSLTKSGAVFSKNQTWANELPRCKQTGYQDRESEFFSQQAAGNQTQSFIECQLHSIAHVLD